jgi:tetratricopeptide (TPR) repeat protein
VTITESRNSALSGRLLVGTLVLLIVACRDDGSGVPPTPLPDGKSDAFGPLPAEVAGFEVTSGAAPGYVADQACEECHASIYESYQSVSMARSFYRLNEDTAVEDFGEAFFQKETRYYYEMYSRDGKYYQKRYCKDRTGERFAEYEAEVAWVIGSGNHARTYLAQTALGEMFEMPLSWYRGTGWGMSPGFSGADHERFERQIQRGCMFCHNAYPEVPVGSDLPGKPHIFPKDLPHGIGCQRCHGPGARHIEAATNPDSSTEDVLQRILNPARLTPQRQEEVCMTCHMQPDVSSGGDSTSRAFDRAAYSHRPDQSIMDYLVYFDFGSAADRDEKIEVNHHSHRLRKSKCYTASGGKLTCLACHDPHRKVKATDRPDYYRSKCLQCHDIDDCAAEAMRTTHNPATADCIACHMLEARPRDVTKVTITDHLIRRKKPTRDLLDTHEPATRNPTQVLEAVPSFPDRAPQGAVLDVHRGLAKAANLRRSEVAALQAALRAANPAVPSPYLRVAIAISGTRDYARAIEVLRGGLARFPRDAALRFQFAMMLHRTGENGEALKQVDRALAIERRPRAIELRGNLLAIAGELRLAKAAFEESLKLRPVRANTWRRYANVLDGLGRTEAAADAFRNAIARNPDLPELYRRLSAIRVRQDRIEEALRVLRHGASRSLELELELILQRCTGDPRLRDAAAAVKLARNAVIQNSESGPAHLYLAFALTLTGEQESAVPVLALARSLGADSTCCTGIALLHAIRDSESQTTDALVARYRDGVKKPSTERLREPIERILSAMLTRRRR